MSNQAKVPYILRVEHELEEERGRRKALEQLANAFLDHTASYGTFDEKKIWVAIDALAAVLGRVRKVEA